MYDLKQKIYSVLNQYKTDFLYDFTSDSNRKELASKLEEAVLKSVPCKVGCDVLMSSKRKKTEKDLTKLQ